MGKNINSAKLHGILLIVIGLAGIVISFIYYIAGMIEGENFIWAIVGLIGSISTILIGLLIIKNILILNHRCKD